MQLDQQIQNYHDQYNKIDSIYSPALNNQVYFRYEGRMHLLYKSPRKFRPSKELLSKITLFPFVIPVIKKTKSIYEVRSHDNSKYYTLVYKVKPQIPAVRVIIKKAGSGSYQFHSIMFHTRGTKKSRHSENL